MLSVTCLGELVLNYSFHYHDRSCAFLVPVVKESEGEGRGPRAGGESTV